MTQHKIGFACKISHRVNDQVEAVESCNFKTTTATWLNNQSRAVAEQRLGELVKTNAVALANAVEWVGQLPVDQRMYRIGSDIFPLFTHQQWSYWYRLAEVRNYIERHLSRIGERARALDVRLSMHPGQFCCLASDREDVVDRSIAEFEYHVWVARCMGYGQRFQDFKINIHLSGRGGEDQFRLSYQRLSAEARNCITLENEETTRGLDQCLALSDRVPIVLDVHHHWVREGEWINATDDRVKQVRDSWRGVTPVVHYSQSQEVLIRDIVGDTMPSMDVILSRGIKRQHLRAHSDVMWNPAVDQLIVQHRTWADVMFECKNKNLAVAEFLNRV